MKTRFTTHIIVEAGMMLAMATLLGRVKLWRAPMGGSVTAGSMVPLLLIAMLRGPKVGIVVGAVYGLIDYLLGGYTVSFIQWLLDYPLAFAGLGFAGLLWLPQVRNFMARISTDSREASRLDLIVPALVLVAVSLGSLLHLGGFFTGEATLLEALRDGNVGKALIYGGTGAVVFSLAWYLVRGLSQATYILPITGAIVGIGLRALCHFLAGVWFFGHFAPGGTPPWIYSLGYNAQYIVPEIIISGVILVYLAPTLMRFLNQRA